MPKKALNVRRIRRNGKQVGYSARLSFAVMHDENTGLRFKPPSKDFFGLTVEIATRKRAEYGRALESATPAMLNSRLTLAEFTTGAYLEKQSRRVDMATLGLRFFDMQQGRMRNYVLDTDLGRTALNKLKPSSIRAYFEGIVRQHLETGKPTASVISSLRKDLSQILKAGRLQLVPPIGLTYSDYFADLSEDLPTVKIGKKAEFDISLLWNIINDETKPLMYRTMVLAQLVVQCRPQDLFALQWDDLDLNAQTVKFSKAMRKTRDGWVVTEGSKTTHKKAAVEARLEPLGPRLASMLQRLRGAATGQCYVFTTRTGKPITHPEFQRVVSKRSRGGVWVAMKAELELPDGPTFYSLKTTGNTFALDNGISVAVQAARMGHSSGREATSHYLGVTLAMKAAALSVWDTLPIPSRAVPALEGKAQG
jgi:integrase